MASSAEMADPHANSAPLPNRAFFFIQHQSGKGFNPDTTLRFRKKQPAAKRRFSEGNSTVSQPAIRSS